MHAANDRLEKARDKPRQREGMRPSKTPTLEQLTVARNLYIYIERERDRERKRERKRDREREKQQKYICILYIVFSMFHYLLCIVFLE